MLWFRAYMILAGVAVAVLILLAAFLMVASAVAGAVAVWS